MQPPQFASQITQAYNVYVNPYGMRRLSPIFQPGCYDVLCARGKLAYDHEGNRRFRELVKQHQKQYSAATCKYEKSKIVSFIVSAVRNASPQGGFVKNIDGAWYEVGDRHAKEKVGQTFRDLLHTKYSSSTKAKARARLRKRINKTEAEDGSRTKKRQKTDDESKPEAVTSKSPRNSRSDSEMRSSISVVSSDGEEDTDIDSDAKTVPHHNREMPPLTSVVVKTPPQQQQAHLLPMVSPPQAVRTQATLLETLRRNNNNNNNTMQTFDGRDPAFLLQRGVGGLTASTNSNGSAPMIPLADLEPLPLGDNNTVVKVDFHDSSSTVQTEQSFEDVMSEFCQNMSVPV